MTDNDPGPGAGPPPTPRWVRLVGAALLIAIVALVILVLVGGHDPSMFRH
jgi:hypothetical protein